MTQIIAMASQGLILLSVAFVLSCHAGSPPSGGFEEQCSSKNDYGWPRFQSLDELKVSPWSKYFIDAYGELPESFPVCIYDLRALDEYAYKSAGITGKALVANRSELKEGDLYSGGLTGYMIYHEEWAPLPDNTWVEVTHTAYPTEIMSYWVWRQRGSNIWYNTGKTKVFPTPANPALIHRDAITFLTKGCSKTPSPGWPEQEQDIFGFCAREKGFDTIQFEPQEGQKPMGTFGQVGLTEIVLVQIDGQYNCGVSDASKTPLRAGWLASRQCDCVNYDIPETCGLMARGPFPFNIIGTSPPLCKVQTGAFWNRWKSCDSMTCKRTTCGPKHRSETPVAIEFPLPAIV